MSGRVIFTDGATLKVRCPACGAGPGEPCRAASLQGAPVSKLRRRSPHADRERALRAERRKGLELRDAQQARLFDD